MKSRILTNTGSVISETTLASVRHALPDYATTLGELKREASGWKMRCPLPGHEDSSPSFSIYPSRSGGYLAHCFGCGWQGDTIALARSLHEGMTFPEAAGQVAQAVGIPCETVSCGSPQTKPRRVQRKPPQSKLPDIPDLPEGFEAAHRAARAKLYGTPLLLDLASKDIGVPAEVIRSLTYSSDALGWGDERLLYLYEHGVKVRGKKGETPRFRWLHGRAVYPWRWHFAARPEVREVFLTESESDAIALIAADCEALHPKGGKPASAVIACPGARGFRDAWAPLFKDKQVTLYFDSDDAGRKGAAKVAQLLERHADRVAIL